MWQIQSGKGTSMLPFWAVFNLYVIFICTSTPGLAISPIMGELTKIFPGTTQFETQLLEIGPNFAAIPFVFIGGWIGTRFNNNKLNTWTCLIYGICGVLFFFVPNMIMLIILSFLIGIFAGILSPLSCAFIADMFQGKKRTQQYGYTSATLNIVLMLSVIATGYLAKINWRLPFAIYLLSFIPLFFAKGFSKYITNPTSIRANDAKKLATPKVHYKFSHEVNMGMLIRYCIFYFAINFVCTAISLYIPFVYSNPSTAGNLTSVMYFGMAISGYTLNWCVRILHRKVAIWTMIAIGASFLIMSITTNMWLVGFAILLSTYFYGIGQPYYYDRLSLASSRIALTLTLAWFASMDSIATVVAAPIIDVIAKIFHTSTSTHPIVAFKICTILIGAGIVVMFIRKLMLEGKIHLDKDRERNEDSTHPMPVGVNEPQPAKVASATASSNATTSSAVANSASTKTTSDTSSTTNTTTLETAKATEVPTPAQAIREPNKEVTEPKSVEPLPATAEQDEELAAIARAKAELAAKSAEEAAFYAEQAAKEAQKYAKDAERGIENLGADNQKKQS